MNEVIDFECDTPTKEAVEDRIALIHAGRGFDKEGYAQLMAPGLGRSAQRQEREVRRNATSAPHP